MADERIVSVKLEQIEQYYGELREKQQSLSREVYLESTTERRAVERTFENAIQACADPAKHIATQDFDWDGSSSKEAISVVAKEGVIDEPTAETLISAIGSETSLLTNTVELTPAKCTKPSRPDSRSTIPTVSRWPSGTEAARGHRANSLQDGRENAA